MNRMSKIARFVKEVRTRFFLFNYSTLFSKIFVKVSGSGSREKDQIVVDQCTIYTWCTPTPTVIALTGACSCAFTDQCTDALLQQEEREIHQELDELVEELGCLFHKFVVNYYFMLKSYCFMFASDK